MTEGEKKKIYYDLRTNDVRVVEEIKSYYTTYTFGRYRVNNYYDYINIAKARSNKAGIFVVMSDADWNDDYPKNDVYEIAVAAQNKAKGKEYTDPYKDIPVDIEIKNLTTRFGKEIMKNADEFFPVDMPKKDAFKTIAKMKQYLAQELKAYYTK